MWAHKAGGRSSQREVEGGSASALRHPSGYGCPFYSPEVKSPENAAHGCCGRRAGLCMADSLPLRAPALIPRGILSAGGRTTACMMLTDRTTLRCGRGSGDERRRGLGLKMLILM